MWQPLFGGEVDDVPITHVTNGVHVPTWLGPEMKGVLDRHLGARWLETADDPATWARVDDIPDTELWTARTASRHRLVEFIRERSADDRLRRGEDLDYAEAAAEGFDARAAHDRLRPAAGHLQAAAPAHLGPAPGRRASSPATGRCSSSSPGKAHPLDEEAKQILQHTFELKGAPAVADQVTFLEDYDLSFAGLLVAGCDVWVNVPRPPEEASGTSGMKAAFNGALNLSVLDGWWAEAYDGTNGWAVDGETDADHEAQDQRHAAAVLDLLEGEVVPLFHDRDPDGVPRRWLDRVRNSLQTNGPRFSAARMVHDYRDQIYPPPT